MNVLIGKIIRGIGGFYYVQTEHGIVVCRARGKFRKLNIKPIVGDIVKIESENLKDGYIYEIFDRENELQRPPVANVDQAVIVFSIKSPVLNSILLDKMIVLSEINNIKPIICINKIDLCEREEYEKLIKIYRKINYTIIATSTITMQGIEELKSCLKDKTSFLSGPSGVGKSSLINCLQSNMKLKTGEISEKISRGKHTTRSVELIPLDFGGFVLDTPGFSSLNIELDKENLKYFFKEFVDLQDGCRFTTCLHENEPGCNIINCVKEGIIDKRRYLNYIAILKELEEEQKRRY